MIGLGRRADTKSIMQDQIFSRWLEAAGTKEAHEFA
jgi:hypothetical protein